MKKNKPKALLCADPANPESARRMKEALKAAGFEDVLVIDNYNQCMLGVRRQGEYAVSNLLRKYQAVIMMGNDEADVAPEYYGKPTYPTTATESKFWDTEQRAQFEMLVIEQAKKKRIPFLGICGGMQRLNTACGGTLHQELQKLVGDDRHSQEKRGISPDQPTHEATVKERSVFHQLVGSLIVWLNSRHHQAIKKIAPDFWPTAYTQERHANSDEMREVVEVIETDPRGTLKDWCAIGIQSHPELLADKTLINNIAKFMKEKALEYVPKPERSPRRPMDHVRQPIYAGASL